ncbi:MAG: HNH endonuclease [Candidatus Eisenbacteria bacterium]|uniref:HNH endonuclease n=1 Tax=Eiseniibacteriota bacterium TaxID=2212470 RepID=A0A948W966_UNCEI|nr:HNH endonuclease [Candidatus Eisenbacteria bacterium]MBU2693446.1 HNH endonuclease [Candidatus Eisenbacteria bacterium]
MSLSPKIRFEIFKRDDFTCRYCGRKTPEVILEVDHVIPISKGGDNEIENLVTSCFECNRGKGATLLEAVPGERDLHEAAILLAERELQLAEYNHVKELSRKREQEELQKLEGHFVTAIEDCPHEYSSREFPRQLVRQALKIISYLDILEYVEYSVWKTAHDTRGDYHNVAAAKYLSAILRNRLREKLAEKNNIQDVE